MNPLENCITCENINHDRTCKLYCRCQYQKDQGEHSIFEHVCMVCNGNMHNEIECPSKCNMIYHHGEIFFMYGVNLNDQKCGKCNGYYHHESQCVLDNYVQ